MCLGTNVSGHKRTRLCPDHTIITCQDTKYVSGHKRTRLCPDHTIITCQGTNVSGHKRVWAQTCLGTNVWVQMCLGTNLCEHKRV